MLFCKPFSRYRVVGYTYLLTLSIFFLFRGKPYDVIGWYPILEDGQEYDLPQDYADMPGWRELSDMG